MDDVAIESQVRFVLYVSTMRTDYSQHGRCWIRKLGVGVDLICVIPISIVFRRRVDCLSPTISENDASMEHVEVKWMWREK